MKSFRLIHHAVTGLVSLGMLVVAPAAKADLISTQQLMPQHGAGTSSDIMRGRQTIDAFLQRADVQQKLQAMGLSQSVSAQRVAALSNAEVRELAGKINTLPVAGSFSDNDLIVILLIAILVVVAAS